MLAQDDDGNTRQLCRVRTEVKKYLEMYYKGSNFHELLQKWLQKHSSIVEPTFFLIQHNNLKSTVVSNYDLSLDPTLRFVPPVYPLYVTFGTKLPNLSEIIARSTTATRSYVPDPHLSL